MAYYPSQGHTGIHRGIFQLKPGDLIRLVSWGPSDDHLLWLGVILETGVPLFENEEPCIPDAVCVHWGSAGIDTVSTDEVEVISESR